MATPDISTPSAQEEPKTYGWRMRSVEIEGWAPLGPGKVSLALSERVTVLVGRNGAGKSALIEAIFLGLDDCVRGPRNGPRSFRAGFEDEGGRRIRYEHSWEPAPEPDPPDPRSPTRKAQKWTERCWYEGQEDRPLWELKDGRATVGAIEIAVPEEGSIPHEVFLRGESPQPQDLPPSWFNLFCEYADRVLAGIPHATEPREGPHSRTGLAFFHRDRETEKEGEAAPGTPALNEWKLIGDIPRRIARTIRKIFSWYQTDSDTGSYTEFVELGKRICAFDTFEVRINDIPHGPSFAQLIVDDTNLGAAPDGTLRLIEILCAMLSIKSRSILLLEEPETGIHPGALGRLLDVIESYSDDRQFMISTHSPVLLEQVRPEDVRIVFRHERQTHVRPLNASEMDRAAAFLNQQGTLGEFFTSGALDES